MLQREKGKISLKKKRIVTDVTAVDRSAKVSKNTVEVAEIAKKNFDNTTATPTPAISVVAAARKIEILGKKRL